MTPASRGEKRRTGSEEVTLGDAYLLLKDCQRHPRCCSWRGCAFLASWAQNIHADAAESKKRDRGDARGRAPEGAT